VTFWNVVMALPVNNLDRRRVVEDDRRRLAGQEAAAALLLTHWPATLTVVPATLSIFGSTPASYLYVVELICRGHRGERRAIAVAHELDRPASRRTKRPAVFEVALHLQKARPGLIVGSGRCAGGQRDVPDADRAARLVNDAMELTTSRRRGWAPVPFANQNVPPDWPRVAPLVTVTVLVVNSVPPDCVMAPLSVIPPATLADPPVTLKVPPALIVMRPEAVSEPPAATVTLAPESTVLIWIPPIVTGVAVAPVWMMG